VSRNRKQTFYLPQKINIIQVKNSTEFASSTQNPKKKKLEHHNNQSKREFSQKKTMFSTFKVKITQKFVSVLPDEICRLDLKS
jgi:hypothetical protein